MIAPLFYMMPAARRSADPRPSTRWTAWWAIKTSDSHFGRHGKLDDAANYLPSRIAALLWSSRGSMTKRREGRVAIWRRGFAPPARTARRRKAPAPRRLAFSLDRRRISANIRQADHRRRGAAD
ncbi:MAG: hypothetical protein ACLUI3_09830 [Christensenellales bacterium]